MVSAEETVLSGVAVGMLALAICRRYIRLAYNRFAARWEQPETTMSQPKSKLSRRTLFAGAGTVGAIAAAASLLPGAVQESAQAPQPKVEPPERGGGYQLTEHVKHYYRTTLV
jgi:hypothetical protein